MPNYILTINTWIMMTSFIKKTTQLNNFKIISNLSGKIIASFPEEELDNVRNKLGNFCTISPMFPQEN